MAAEIREDTAAITIADSTKPDVKLLATSAQNVAFWNLTVGFNEDERLLQPAFKLKASVSMRGNDSDISQWTFGFLQFMRVIDTRFGWAGRTATEGSILLNLNPILGGRNILDTAPVTQRPFFTTPTTGQETDLIEFEMGDHPFVKLAHKAPNATTGFDNFLFFVNDRRRAVSVMVAREPNGKSHYLAHVFWEISYDTRLSWVGGRPQITKQASTFTIFPAEKGPPPSVTRAELDGVKPSQQTANDQTVKAFGNAANFQSLSSTFFELPGDFFT